MSLLEEAKKITLNLRVYKEKFNEEKIELVLAVLSGEIRDVQAGKTLGYHQQQQFASHAWSIVKEAYRRGYITINFKK